jgi:hypothetical protein
MPKGPFIYLKMSAHILNTVCIIKELMQYLEREVHGNISIVNYIFSVLLNATINI